MAFSPDTKCMHVFEGGPMVAQPGTQTFDMPLKMVSFLYEIANWGYENRVLFDRDPLKSSMIVLGAVIQDIENAIRRSNKEAEA